MFLFLRWILPGLDGHALPDLADYVTAGLVSGAIFVASDAVAQLYLRKSGKLNGLQLGRLGLFGLAVKGPLQSLYYSAVEAIAPGRGGFRQVGAKMMADLFFFSPLVNALFLFCVPLLEGRALKAAIRNVLTEIIPVQRAALNFWVLAHAINYVLVSNHYRVIYVNFMGFLWTVILCCFAGQQSQAVKQNNKKLLPKTGQSTFQPQSKEPPVRLVQLKNSGRSCSDTLGHKKLQEVLQNKALLESMQPCVSSSNSSSQTDMKSLAALQVSPLKLRHSNAAVRDCTVDISLDCEDGRDTLSPKEHARPPGSNLGNYFGDALARTMPSIQLP
mmetsp:Transcript_29023/g.81765  ORF Transcript_29023/g.81765 Transcript_29023/m.81765 type:complete len:330 (+) Transcript_29023:552-1541(+)|eukprot:CAMPEP_0117665382 /NCGR_PEP_ID=MMETSP0804-20121206/9779_1 /TAXON_ID=1074897 /ORGANISM="Tetraselmis astigmatica, Strain CCMP880" /LENGTH=329 /DNA_ID=CAMNT_0005472789 /DNA_START=486 /DNA_END=1475 /DNA_ORIENTATION=+